MMATNNVHSLPPGRLKKWLVAVRPWAYPASIMPVLFGTSLAAVYGGVVIKPVLFILSLVAMVILHSAANLLSDVFDYQQGLDQVVTPVSGALVRGWITTGQARRGAAILFALGSSLGLLLVYLTTPLLLYIGGLGVAIGLGYTLMKYHAAGDLAVFLNFGLLGSLGAWVVQTRTFSWLPLIWAVPISLLVVAILHANNWRDIASDSKQQITTVAVLLGDKGSLFYYGVLLFGSMGLILGLVFLPRIFFSGQGNITMPLTFLLCLLALPKAISLWRRALHRHQPRQALDFIILDGATSQYNLIFGTLCLLAIWLDYFI